MAEKTTKTEEVTELAERPFAEMPAEATKNNSRKWVIGGGIALGVLVAFMLGAFISGARDMGMARFIGRDLDGDRDGRPGMISDRGGMRSGGMMRGGSYDSNTMVHGVVSAVSDSEMTIVGNGVSKKVTLTSSTTYGNNKPKVNDSVMARGTTSGETFTATSVQVVNH